MKVNRARYLPVELVLRSIPCSHSYPRAPPPPSPVYAVGLYDIILRRYDSLVAEVPKASTHTPSNYYARTHGACKTSCPKFASMQALFSQGRSTCSKPKTQLNAPSLGTTSQGDTSSFFSQNFGFYPLQTKISSTLSFATTSRMVSTTSAANASFF